MNHFLKEDWLYFVAALFLISALGDWPYGYFQLLRWVVCGVGAYSAYAAYEAGRTGWTWVLGIIAVLFNPIVPFYLEREIWLVIDLAAAVFFVAYPFSNKKHS